MDRLWSPWRSEYVTGAADASRGSCFLCEAASAEEFTANNLLVARTEQVVVLLNRYPYNAGHLLVAPRKHEGQLSVLDSTLACELVTMVQAAVRVVERELQPHGINIGANLGRAAGAGVPDHLHFHVVPRWNGDTNFMPVMAETKVISSALERMWKQLLDAFAERGLDDQSRSAKRD